MPKPGKISAILLIGLICFRCSILRCEAGDQPAVAFSEETVYTHGGQGWSLVSADLNGDGHLDLALGGSFLGRSYVDILYNGAFTAGSTTELNNGATELISTDGDKDGTLDLIAAGAAGASLLINQGDAFSFEAHTFIERLDEAGEVVHVRGLAAADFDQDGMQELAVAINLQRVRLFINEEAGYTPLDLSIFEGPYSSLVAADLDSDGKQDLAALDASRQRVILFYNDGGLTFHKESGPGVLSQGTDLIATDLNGDTLLDLVAGSMGQRITGLLNGGNRTFNPTRLELATGGIGPRAVCASDFDLDGDFDIAVAHYGAGGGNTGNGTTMSVLLNAGDATFASPVIYTVGYELLAIVEVDSDDDCWPDLAVTHRSSLGLQEGVMTVYRNTTVMPPERDGNRNGLPDLCEGQSSDILFLRGDCNSDGPAGEALKDALYLLDYNFLSGPEPRCLAACDANQDGQVEGQVTDAIYLLTYTLFRGPPPPAPFPDCGTSKHEADMILGCAERNASCR